MDAGSQPSVSVVSVAYNSVGVLPDMAASLPAGVDLIVVDNGPDDGLRAWAEHAGHKVIVPGENLGFGGGCNLGARDVQSDFIFFLNPDARLMEGALETLLKQAGKHPNASAFGPQFGVTVQNRYKVRPSKILWRGFFAKRYTRPDVPTPVPSLNGAGILVRRDAFEAIGGFDERIFLFFEDDDISLRLAAKQGPLIYVPEARVLHAIASSSPSSLELVEFKAYHYLRGYVYTLSKHGRSVPKLRGCLNVVRRFISLRNLSSAERRADARGRFRGLASILGEALPRSY
ncbi:glycosyltransferase family 2 protein [Cognatishimia sp.]|uniref:glycosyltransferase family 2 protein n=1 Tax=Cognatishimia sp. TaxID=2211648 RepID=UPI003514F7EC